MTSGPRDNLKRYEQRMAREELSGWRTPFSWRRLALGAVLAFGYGVTELPAPHAWAILAAAGGLGLLAHGLRGFHPWSRWTAVAVFGAGAVMSVLTREGGSPHWIWSLVLQAACAIYLALPSTSRLFVLARGEDVDRARA